MILPPFVGAIGVKQILGQAGALNSLLQATGLMSPEHPVDWLGQGRFWGVVVMNALHLYPILYLNVVAALANLDPAMEEAAENLGCTGLSQVPPHHSSTNNAGAFCRRNDRLYLGFYRIRRAADV